MKAIKRVLVLNRSFWPDVEATGQFLTELCEGLAKGYRVTVIAGRSYYVGKETFGIWRFYSRETFSGINILRVRHTRFGKKSLIWRIANWLTYSILAFIVALRIKSEMIIACTDSPFLGIIGMVISRLKSIPFIYNCRDLFPDVAWGLGRLDRDNWVGRLYDWLNKKAFHSAALVVCLGPSMKNRITQKRIADARIKVITDWVDTSKIRLIPKNENPLIEKFGLKDKFVVMYSGNIGLSQDFRLILQAMNAIKDKFSFYLIFAGEGVGKKTLQREADSLGFNNVLFLPYQPLDMLSFSLSMADLHLVPLKKGMAGAVVPSKVYGIMAAGRPYLAITDRDSEPARLAEEFGCGLWADPDDLNAISNNLKWSFQHPNELESMGTIGRGIAEARFEKDAVINEWLDTLENLNRI